MSLRMRRRGYRVTSAVIIATGLFALGYAAATAHRSTPPSGSYASGRTDGYLAGLRAGEALGRQEGRALQEGATVPADSREPVQDAFNAGYAAGANDVFSGYDGGWALSQPYVVLLEHGAGQIAYRVSSRTPVQAGVDYYLCPDGREICEQARP